MKMAFVCFIRLVFIGLFVIYITGCGGDDNTEETVPLSRMEQLVGRYTLEWLEYEEDGVLVRFTKIDDEDIAGELALGAAGRNASIALNFGAEAYNSFGATWKVSQKILTIDGDPTPYTWDGTYLEFSILDEEEGSTVRVRWKKLS